jgi:hypothetical protein
MVESSTIRRDTHIHEVAWSDAAALCLTSEAKIKNTSINNNNIDMRIKTLGPKEMERQRPNHEKQKQGGGRRRISGQNARTGLCILRLTKTAVPTGLRRGNEFFIKLAFAY